MENRPRYMDLALWLTALLRQGIIVSKEVSAYLEATFGTTDLTAVLANDDDSEIDSLLELIFFPDKEIQIRFEDRWGDIPFSKEDRDQIVRHLCAAPPYAPLKNNPSNGPPLVIQVPDFALAAFVRRLHVTWQPKNRLAQALKNHPVREKYLSLRVHLRNARIDWNPDQVELISRFLSNMPSDSEDLEALLCFLIALVSDDTVGIDFFEFLIEKKLFFFQSLCRAEAFERKRQTSNMETMMLQGARSAHGNMDEWRRYMRYVDQICHALFGRTHFFQQPAERCVDLQNGNNHEAMLNVIRALS